MFDWTLFFCCLRHMSRVRAPYLNEYVSVFGLVQRRRKQRKIQFVIAEARTAPFFSARQKTPRPRASRRARHRST